YVRGSNKTTFEDCFAVSILTTFCFGSKVNWHFIGSLQTRKVKEIINEIDYLHSLDRLSLAKEIQKRADKKVKCFIQVKTSSEESKQGLAIEEVVSFTFLVCNEPIKCQLTFEPKCSYFCKKPSFLFSPKSITPASITSFVFSIPTVFVVLSYAIEIYSWALIIYILLSWFPGA
ncbi:hypothetical protein N3930_40135, partial [Bacillus thuringiensis]|nr:hypothetical protein [Bacillus thuringiensis]